MGKKRYYLNPAGNPLKSNGPHPSWNEITEEEYNIIIAEKEAEKNQREEEIINSPTLSLEDVIEAKVLQMIEDRIVKPGQDYEPPE